MHGPVASEPMKAEHAQNSTRVELFTPFMEDVKSTKGGLTLKQTLLSVNFGHFLVLLDRWPCSGSVLQ